MTNERYVHLHDSAARLMERFGGKTAANVVRRAEEAAKGMLWPSLFFEEFGLTYYGPIDGHNLGLLIETFKFLKPQHRPVILHAMTQKGRGFQPALDKQKKFHGLGPYDPETGETKAVGAEDVFRSICRNDGEAGEREREGGRDYRRDAERHGAGSVPAASSRRNISMWALRRSMR